MLLHHCVILGSCGPNRVCYFTCPDKACHFTSLEEKVLPRNSCVLAPLFTNVFRQYLYDSISPTTPLVHGFPSTRCLRQYLLNNISSATSLRQYSFGNLLGNAASASKDSFPSHNCCSYIYMLAYVCSTTWNEPTCPTYSTCLSLWTMARDGQSNTFFAFLCGSMLSSMLTAFQHQYESAHALFEGHNSLETQLRQASETYTLNDWAITLSRGNPTTLLQHHLCPQLPCIPSRSRVRYWLARTIAWPRRNMLEIEDENNNQQKY